MIGAMATNVVIGSQAKAAACDTAACLNGPQARAVGDVLRPGRVGRLPRPSGGPGAGLLGGGILAPDGADPPFAVPGDARLWVGNITIAFGASAITMAAIVGVAGEPPAVVAAWTVAAAFSVAGLVGVVLPSSNRLKG